MHLYLLVALGVSLAVILRIGVDNQRQKADKLRPPVQHMDQQSYHGENGLVQVQLPLSIQCIAGYVSLTLLLSHPIIY